jgi:hypothetical protein
LQGSQQIHRSHEPVLSCRDQTPIAPQVMIQHPQVVFATCPDEPPQPFVPREDGVVEEYATANHSLPAKILRKLGRREDYLADLHQQSSATEPLSSSLFPGHVNKNHVGGALDDLFLAANLVDRHEFKPGRSHVEEVAPPMRRSELPPVCDRCRRLHRKCDRMMPCSECRMRNSVCVTGNVKRSSGERGGRPPKRRGRPEDGDSPLVPRNTKADEQRRHHLPNVLEATLPDPKNAISLSDIMQAFVPVPPATKVVTGIAECEHHQHGPPPPPVVCNSAPRVMKKIKIENGSSSSSSSANV